MAKIDIPQDILDKAGIKGKPSPEQLKAIFAQLAEKGLLKDKSSTKKVGGKAGIKGTGSHAGLILKEVEVTRDGKTFKRKQWVKPGEDEPVPEKGKKEEPEVKGKFNVGDSISFMGKELKIDNISESEQTIKLSDGNVYTFGAIEKFSKPTKDPIEDIKDEIKNLKDEIKEIKKPKPEPKVEIKPEPKVTIRKEPKIKSKLEKNKTILLKDLVKSKEEAKKLVEDSGWVWDIESDIFPNVNDYDNNRYPTKIHTDDDGKIYGMSQVIISDKNELTGKKGKWGSIEYIEINTPMRGKGYGKRMMKDVISTMIDCDGVTLMSLDKNSNKFYEAIGMKPISKKVDEPGYVGDKKWIKSIIGTPKPEKKAKKESIKEEEISKTMTPDKIDSIKSLSDMKVEGGINEATTNIIKFKDGSKGVYKTASALGTQGEMNFKGISKILGWDNAPETVKGDFGNGEGSCQKWVENIAIDDINEVEITEKHFDDLAKIAIVDMITGNWDRHYNNVKLDKSGKVWAIDNDTWGDETQYDVNKARKNMYACKLSWWSEIRGDKADRFQPYADKYVKEIVEHKDEIVNLINDINKNETKFKSDYKKRFEQEFKAEIDVEGMNKDQVKEAKNEFMIEFGDYQPVKELTKNMINNLNRVTGGK